MLTPIEIQSKSFKAGIGYDRKDVDGFMREILAGYEKLYKENKHEEYLRRIFPNEIVDYIMK